MVLDFFYFYDIPSFKLGVWILQVCHLHRLKISNRQVVSVWWRDRFLELEVSCWDRAKHAFKKKTDFFY